MIIKVTNNLTGETEAVDTAKLVKKSRSLKRRAAYFGKSREGEDRNDR